MLRFSAILLAILLFVLPCVAHSQSFVACSDAKTPLVAVQAVPGPAALLSRSDSSDPLQPLRWTGEMNWSGAAVRFMALSTRGGRLSDALGSHLDRVALRCEQDSLRI